MKRGWIYLVFGPIFGMLGLLLLEMMKGRLSAALRDPAEGAFLAFVFCFFVSFTTLLVDASLARVLPIVVRAPLVAASGTAIAFAYSAGTLGGLPPLDWFMPISIDAAASMGACSFLANDFSRD